MTYDAYATTELAANTSESTLGASSGGQSVAPSQIGSYATLEAKTRDALREEANILCDLDHPNIARVRDFDFVDGQPNAQGILI